MGLQNTKAPKALYRKYRSKTLDEIVGQEHITNTLKNAVKQNKVSHAYLFTGPRGVGKTSIARILAHDINKLAYSDETPHLDIIEIDAASNRRIDDIRDLREKVHIAPLAAKYKVYIIDEVHMLTTESFNALLKTLEEPPSHVVFILATTEVHKLPATIVSRTQRHTFRSIPAPQVAQHLRVIAEAEKISIDEEALLLLAQHGEGSFRDSISLLDQMSHLGAPVTQTTVEQLLGVAPADQLQALLEYIKRTQTSEILTALEGLKNHGLTAAGIAMQLVGWLRNNLQNDLITIETLRLMEELLQVPSSPFSDLKLEAILLRHALESASDASAAQLMNRRSAKTPVQPAIEKKETSSRKKSPRPDRPKKSSALEVDPKNIQDRWPSVLQEVKKRNNSLYTILRLAQPSIEGGSLCLTFGFGFHQKRAEETKHKALVAEVLQDILKAPLDVITKVDQTLVNQPLTSHTMHLADAPEVIHPSLIDDIQAIMGGGEVLDA